jgi:hypothetical protein
MLRHIYHGSTLPGKDAPTGRRDERAITAPATAGNWPGGDLSAAFVPLSIRRPDGGYGPSGAMVGDTTLSAAMRFRDTFRSR